MVRVISVHHFAKQEVRSVEAARAAVIAPPHRLLLALASHTIEVRDLRLAGDVLFAFPTVDAVTQLCHCVNGDYVATLESRCNRANGEDVRNVRVYVNWDTLGTLQQCKMNESGASLTASECGMVQAMRARIAGRVTPTTNHGELASLEMIEMPVERNPHAIAVCQTSGNLLVAAGAHLTFYRFTVRTHDISKLKFIDFADAGIDVQLPFEPRECHLAENYVAAMNADCMQLFQLMTSSAIDSPVAVDDVTFTDEQQPIDARHVMQSKKQSGGRVHLPTIARANSAIHRHGACAMSDTPTVTSSSTDEQLRIVNLVQLRRLHEHFKCVVLRPLYVDAAAASKAKEDGGCAGGGGRGAHAQYRPLRSAFVGNLHSVACMVGTQQEGYMYHFIDGCVTQPDDDDDGCITVYPFTAPVQQMALEDDVLHALTDAGVESYTLRVCHRVCESVRSVCPPMGEAVCLVGLRPFVGVEQLLVDGAHVVMLASGDAGASPTYSTSSSSTTSSTTTSTWTLYVLEAASPQTLHDEMSAMAHAHRITSPTTYCHLLGEAHMILRAALLLYRWAWCAQRASMRSVRPARTAAAVAAHATSAAHLADYHVTSAHEGEYARAAAYYQMAGVTDALEVVERVRRVHAQQPSASPPFAGLVAYLRTALTTSTTSNTSSSSKLCDAVLNVFAAHAYDALPSLVLSASILRDHATERLIAILDDAPHANGERHLALAALNALKGDVSTARRHLDAIADEELTHLLVEHCDLMLEHVSFTELTSLLMIARGDLLAAIFAAMIQRRALTLSRLLRAFADCAPSSGGETSAYGRVLQATLEHYLRHYFDGHDVGVAYERSTHEALKLLVRSYVAQLLQISDTTTTTTPSSGYLFSKQRHIYFDLLPPFQGHAKVVTGNDIALMKLQALVCARALPAQVLAELSAFVTAHEGMRGRLAMQVCIANVGDALPLLVDACPQCALQYAKDVFGKSDEWKLLIATVQRKIVSASGSSTTTTMVYKQLLRGVLPMRCV